MFKGTNTQFPRILISHISLIFAWILLKIWKPISIKASDLSRKHLQIQYHGFENFLLSLLDGSVVLDLENPIWILVLICEIWLVDVSNLWFGWENSYGSGWFWCLWQKLVRNFVIDRICAFGLGDFIDALLLFGSWEKCELTFWMWSKTWDLKLCFFFYPKLAR